MDAVKQMDEHGCVSWTNLKDRKGAWMQCYSGTRFFPIDPRPEEVDPVDIAHALSLACRYGGHVKRFYSVAEHCVILYRAASPENRLWALLHDAPEAYIADIVRPAKGALQPAYGNVEAGIMAAVCMRFGLEPDMPDEVKELDNLILYNEAVELLTPCSDPETGRDWWHAYAPGLGSTKIEGWAPERAEREFLACLQEEMTRRAVQ